MKRGVFSFKALFFTKGHNLTVLAFTLTYYCEFANFIRTSTLHRLMSKQVETTIQKKKSKPSVREILKFLDQEFIQNKWVVLVAAIIAPFMFVTSRYVPLEPSFWHWIQTLFFLVTAVCLVIVLSFLVNKLWLKILKDEPTEQEEKKDSN